MVIEEVIFMCKKGFTLIEMLIVVLIIGILVTLVFPQYMRSLEKSRYSEAAELLRSIYTAEQRYALEHSGYAEDFDDLYLDFSDVALEREDKSTIVVKNYKITLQNANADIPLVQAIRAKGGNNIYGIYKNLRTGAIFCEDMLEKDNITCDLFGIWSSLKTCEDGSVIDNGEECPKEEQQEETHVCPNNFEWNSSQGKCTQICANPPCKKIKAVCPSGYSWNLTECVQ